jgi:hypothetical protein
MIYGAAPRCLLCGEAALLVAQYLGRTGPIPPSPGGVSWTSLLAIALLWAVISAAVMLVSVRSGMRRLAWGWTASLIVGLLVATYSFWRL